MQQTSKERDSSAAALASCWWGSDEAPIWEELSAARSSLLVACTAGASVAQAVHAQHRSKRCAAACAQPDQALKLGMQAHHQGLQGVKARLSRWHKVLIACTLEPCQVGSTKRQIFELTWCSNMHQN